VARGSRTTRRRYESSSVLIVHNCHRAVPWLDQQNFGKYWVRNCRACGSGATKFVRRVALRLSSVENLQDSSPHGVRDAFHPHRQIDVVGRLRRNGSDPDALLRVQHHFVLLSRLKSTTTKERSLARLGIDERRNTFTQIILTQLILSDIFTPWLRN